MATRENKAVIMSHANFINETVQAGVDALPAENRRSFGKSINDSVNQVVEADLFKQYPELIHTWNEIFESAGLNEMISLLAQKLDSDIYYRFGEYLISIVSERDYDRQTAACKLIHSYLDVFRQSEFLIKIYEQKKWELLIHKLIVISNFNVAAMFRQRVKEYNKKVLFKVFHGNTETDYSWNQIDELVKGYSFGLAKLALQNGDKPSKVAFLMENSLNMALLDLACLTTGIVNIMIPANSVEQHVEFILNQTEASIVFVANDKQLAKVKSLRKNLKHLKNVVLMEGSSIEDWVMTFQEMVAQGISLPEKSYLTLQKNIKIDELATIMYTSGTTGDPKGIMFSNMNLVYKRFCRAMALPKIGHQDRFLAYLPLFHTFGRYLEMLGSVFWGAEYGFMENPALETMLDNMERLKPTVFISIPKKWYQLYEYISQKTDIEFDDEKIIKRAVKKATGGKLAWGLSAAGYLEPDVFQFFQRYGIEVMSGFGMTEATGGITMTPPGQYIPNSLGRPLPGIDVKLGHDGELLIKGAYVMMGYYGLKSGEDSFTDGWFPTGDVMKQDENKFYEIIDRKKEIYKNVKGETIAPQKIENYFRDFEFIKQVFLVGDHRQYNTVLIYPDEEKVITALKGMDEAEKQAYFSSVVVTVNKFLAPYERIVDFRIIDRPFTAEEGELTPKGTYKRRVIENNFNDIINLMYTKNYTSLLWGKTEIRVPNWFLREKGCLKGDIKTTADGLSIPKYDQVLRIKQNDGHPEILQIGDFNYKIERNYIDFQIFLANPLYWLGNTKLIEFAGDAIFQWYRLDGSNELVQYYSTTGPVDLNGRLLDLMNMVLSGGEKSLMGLNLAAIHLRSDNFEEAAYGIDYLAMIFEDENLPFYSLALDLISRPNFSIHAGIRRQLFKLGLPIFKGKNFEWFLKIFIRDDAEIIDNELIEDIVKASRGDENLNAIYAAIKSELTGLSKKANLQKTALPSLFQLLATYGIYHPTRYKRVRQLIVKYQLRNDWQQLSELASEARIKLLDGFRDWLGSNQTVAVDVETGEEYRWSDVIIFEQDIPDSDRQRQLDAITNSSILREAIFLFSNGNMIRLYDIPPGGIWVSQLSSSNEKSVYRVSVQTRYQGGYDITLNLNKNYPTEQILSEMNWLIHAGATKDGLSLVDDFGGYWREYDLWSEEFASGDSVGKIMQRGIRKKNEEMNRRLFYLWPFFMRTAMAAHISFWRRTGYKMALTDKSINNIIVPSHDYQTGVRFISIAERVATTNAVELLHDFSEQFIKTSEEHYPFIKRESFCFYVFSGILDALGEENGLKLLKKIYREVKNSEIPCPMNDLADSLNEFITQTRKNGFVPKKLYFAIKRFHRWYNLSKDAAFTAQARTLNELADTYQLQELDRQYPETRTRFFLETVFADSSGQLKEEMMDIVRKQHKKNISTEETLSLLSSVQKEYTLNEKEAFFLTRLSYPHLKPTDSAVLVSTLSDGGSMADVVVRMDDYDGVPFQVRRPVSPKEISRLHQLFLEASLPVNFRPEHRFLVSVSERGHIIGGLFYSYIDEKTVYMEKIVVSNRYRRKGISEGIMNEFFNRLRDEYVELVTTAFLRPEYFYRFGFKVEKKYSGLVKDLRTGFPKTEDDTLKI